MSTSSAEVVNDEGNHQAILATQILGNVFVALIVISAMPTFWKMDRTRNVGNFNIYPFIAMVGQNIMWVVYGTVCKVEGLVYVNAFGMFINLLHVMVFLSVCGEVSQKRKVILATFIDVTVMGVFTLVVVWLAPEDKFNSIFGWFCSILLVVFFMSPCYFFYSMYKARSVDSLSIPLLITSIIAGVAFGMYGVLLKDWFVTVSNFSGTLSGVLQLLFFVIMKVFIIKPEDMVKKDDIIEYQEEIKLEMRKEVKGKDDDDNQDKETDNENDLDDKGHVQEEESIASEQGHQTIDVGGDSGSD
ncbi:hypothetical protein CYY_000615 [Polysphondylium violaceum]|uniref:Bidirectional sugar transporter SWEET n=1 Tax=Polysphondylium violaceum TaxID=133409 RepID=A0A8J4Q3A2_9MYCE|nr:hypothetical protein CYY_000615 [Polysphondylium violaceum]